jgi:NADH-quinone oxidoreductase subunit F
VGFSAGLKWSFIDKIWKTETFVCNADESNRNIQRPLFDGIYSSLIDRRNDHCQLHWEQTCPTSTFVENTWVYKILEKAIEAKAAGYGRENILGTGYDLELYVHIGAGAYICGEETALIESLKEKRNLYQTTISSSFWIMGKTYRG